MKWTRALILMFGLAHVGHVVANDADYKFCSIAGYAFGSGQMFLASLAVEVAKRKEIFDNNSVCASLWRNGRDAGLYVEKTKSVRGGDQKIIRDYAEFEARIQNAILKSAGY